MTRRRRGYIRFFADVLVTLVLWIYFTLGFVFISPAYIATYVFSRNRRSAFQKWNNRFLRGLLWLLRNMVSGLAIEMDKRIFDLRSCVVVSNHRSYLDPVILVTAFEKHCTIVKSGFFRVPVFGRIINAAGYIPSYGGNDKMAALLHQRVLDMNAYLSGGGVLFVFPEGTRSRDGRLAPFHTGAFKIAQRTGAPLEVICITNTEKLFAPGRFLFHTGFANKIEIRQIGRIPPEDDSRAHISDFMAKTREMMENHLEGR